MLERSFNANLEIDSDGNEDAFSIKEQAQDITNAPKICLIDFSSEGAARLKSLGFNSCIGTLGTLVEVPNQKKYQVHPCLNNSSFPLNLHEYNVVIINMCNPPSIPYKFTDHTRKLASSREQNYFICKHPETIFDPRPFGSTKIRTQIDKVLESGGVLIVFAGRNYTFTYSLGERLSDDTLEEVNKEELTIYDFSDDIPSVKNEFGEEISVLNYNEEFNDLLNKYVKDAKYEIIFNPSEWWLKDLSNNNCRFLPLMVNSRNEITSFYKTHKNHGHVIVFPQIENKLLFLEDLLTKTLPSFIPDAFPQYSTFSWVNKEIYILPNEAELTAKMEETKIKYEKLLITIQEEIDANYTQYEWLHKLITETDYELVAVVKQYLEWLGFENVIDMDKINPNLKEEDLQIEIDDKLLVIEIKGIGGTSKDSECSQVAKIVGRRMREKETTKVHGLYIVNHQRFQEPLLRSNPPFTTKQIGDAEYESRGLLTTYQLFNLYFSIENGVISKEYAREQFQKSGLIEFIPKDCISLGKPHEIYRDGEIIILNIDMHVKQNDELIIHRNGKYLKTQILEIKDNDRAVIEAFSGEIGFKVDKIVKKTDELFFMNKIDKSNS